MSFLKRLVLSGLTILLLDLELIKPLKANEFEDLASLNLYGMPGEIELPVAKNLPDGQFSISSSAFGGTLRLNSFQFRKSHWSRYSRIPGGKFNGTLGTEFRPSLFIS